MNNNLNFALTATDFTFWMLSSLVFGGILSLRSAILEKSFHSFPAVMAGIVVGGILNLAAKLIVFAEFAKWWND